MKKLILLLMMLAALLQDTALSQTAQTALSNAVAGGYGKLPPQDLESIYAYALMLPVGAGTAQTALSNAMVNGYGGVAPEDLQAIMAYGAATSSGGGGAGTNAIEPPAASVQSYLIKPVGSFTDHNTVFTNLQECFNVISNLSTTYSVLSANNGNIFTQPFTTYAVHLDTGAVCYQPSGFRLNVQYNGFIKLTGDRGSQIIGDSNVLTCVNVAGQNAVGDIEVSGIQFLFNNPYAKTMAVFLYGERLNFHDNFVGGYSILQTNAIGIWTQANPYTNSPGMIGLMGAGVNGIQIANGNKFAGCAVALVAPAEHWRMFNNEFGGFGYPAPHNGNTNAWNNGDQFQIVPPGVAAGNFNAVYGWQMALGEDVFCQGQGDTIMAYNHFAGGIYFIDGSGLGQNAIYYNGFEGGRTPTNNLMVETTFLANPPVDFWGNVPAQQVISVFNHADLMTLTNIWLSGFKNTAGTLDATLNGAYVLKQASGQITSTNLTTGFAIWTNAANTDARLFLTNSDNGQSLYTSNSASGLNGFTVASFFNTASILNGTTAMPIPASPASVLGFEVDNAGGSAVAGSYSIGTNSAYLMRPQTTNAVAIMDGCTRMVSNTVTYFYVGGVWTNAYSGNFTGNGSGLTNAVAGGFTNSPSQTMAANGAFLSMPAAGFETVCIEMTNTPIVWLTNATTGKYIYFGTLGLGAALTTITNFGNAMWPVNANDSIQVTNPSGVGGVRIVTNWFSAYK